MENLTSQSVLSNVVPRSQFTLPNGRKLAIKNTVGNGLYRIVFEDKLPGELPERYAGQYTKPEYATADIVSYTNEVWELQEATNKSKVNNKG